jgi:hypothetical protein
MPAPMSPWSYGPETTYRVGKLVQRSPWDVVYVLDQLSIRKLHKGPSGEDELVNIEKNLAPRKQHSILLAQLTAISGWATALERVMAHNVENYNRGEEPEFVTYHLVSPNSGSISKKLGTLPCHVS